MTGHEDTNANMVVELFEVVQKSAKALEKIPEVASEISAKLSDSIV